MKDDHANCENPETCLCAESHVKSAGVSKKGTYTSSWLRNKIEEYIKHNKKMSAMLYSFRAYPNGTFLFDPTLDKEILDLFLDNQTEFLTQLKAACFVLLSHWSSQSMRDTVFHFRNFKVKISDSKFVPFGELGPQWENIPISTEAIVVSTEIEKTYTKFAEAICKGCLRRFVLEVNPYDHKLQDPPRCMNEDCSHYEQTMFIDPETFENGPYRIVTLQEPMEESRHGSPRLMKCELLDDSVRETFIGQRKRIVGTFTSRISKKDSTHDILLKAISVNDVLDAGTEPITDEEIKEFQKWVKDQSFFKKLCESFAPEIYGEDLAKLSVLIGIIGGMTQGRLRGDIHVFLIGDPSTGKSKILGFVVKVTDTSDYINGATASGAGITVAYDDKLKAPRIGPLALCSGGVVAIDELSRLQSGDLDKLLQSMEDGFMKYTKGGYNIQVKAETTILGGANPKNDYYNHDLAIVDNINLPGPLISRFDLRVNVEHTSNTATVINKLAHIDEFRLLGEDAFIKKHSLFPPEKIKRFIKYAKSLEPVMSKEASVLRHTFFADMLELQQKLGSLPIDTRFYEGLYRIATAIARLKLSKTVTAEHMQMAIDHQKNCLLTFRMDVTKGQSQLSMQEESASKDGAFLHCFREAQAKVQEEYVTADSVIEEMVKRYKERHKWLNEDIAGAYWQIMEEQKRVLRKGKKFRLAGV